MNDCLGWKLNDALAYYHNLGVTATVQKVCCRREKPGDSERVVQERRIDEANVVLRYAVFQTTIPD